MVTLMVDFEYDLIPVIIVKVMTINLVIIIKKIMVTVIKIAVGKDMTHSKV